MKTKYLKIIESINPNSHTQALKILSTLKKSEKLNITLTENLLLRDIFKLIEIVNKNHNQSDLISKYIIQYLMESMTPGHLFEIIYQGVSYVKTSQEDILDISKLIYEKVIQNNIYKYEKRSKDNKNTAYIDHEWKRRIRSTLCLVVNSEYECYLLSEEFLSSKNLIKPQNMWNVNGSYLTVLRKELGSTSYYAEISKEYANWLNKIEKIQIEFEPKLIGLLIDYLKELDREVNLRQPEINKDLDFNKENYHKDIWWEKHVYLAKYNEWKNDKEEIYRLCKCLCLIIECDYKIWTPIKFDYRLRLYYEGFINVQSFKLLRMCIKFDSEPYSQLDDSILSEIKDEHIVKRSIELYKNGIVNSFPISSDATASMLQIISIICRNSWLSTISNVYGDSLRYDPYKELSNEMGLSDSISRKDFKIIVMKYIYGSNWIQQARWFKENVYYNKGLDYSKKISKSVIEKINKNLELDFKYLKSIKNICVFIHNNYNGITIKGCNSTFSFKHFKEKSVKIELYNKIEDTKQKKVEIKRKVILNEIDKIKIRNSSLPNLIHYLDGKILSEVVGKMIDNGKRICTVHDCFISSIKDYEIINKIYVESLFSIYETDILKLINPMNYKINDKIMNEYYKYKNLIDQREYKANHIVKSKNALKP